MHFLFYGLLGLKGTAPLLDITWSIKQFMVRKDLNRVIKSLSLHLNSTMKALVIFSNIPIPNIP